jgi:hypothetical protein
MSQRRRMSIAGGELGSASSPMLGLMAPMALETATEEVSFRFPDLS